MHPLFWSARAGLGGLGILCIAGLIGTYPHPDYRPGVMTMLVAIGVFPSLATIVALVLGGVRAQWMIPRLVWFPLCWAVVALPVALVMSLNVHAFPVVLALPLQLTLLPLLVATREPSRILLLQRIVRIGLAVMGTVWVVASVAFAGFVRLEAGRIADGGPYCLSAPTPGQIYRSSVLPQDLDVLLLQRIIAFPVRPDYSRYRLQINVPGAEVEQWHFSFWKGGFEPGGDTVDCGDRLRWSTSAGPGQAP